MNIFASLDPRDRKLLVITLSVTVLVVIVTALFAGDVTSNDDPVPSTYKTGRHGAHAAYDLLESNGYHVQRWEDSIGLLALKVNSKSVVIFADPHLTSTDDFKAVQEMLHRGARVLATGFSGGALVPGSAVIPSQRLDAACELTPQGLNPLAASGSVWMATPATWQLGDPRYRVDYYCASEPAVVEYAEGAGHVVWWASATPLENGSITRSDNLSIFLNALGPREGHDFYWDESLHGEAHSQWFYARGPALNFLLIGLFAIAIMVVFSFSRRSGPLRNVPAPARATPVEFLEALGSLYGKAGASTTALSLAYDGFRRQMGELCGRKGLQMNAAELAVALRARFPQAPPEIDEDLATCERELGNERLEPKRALAMVQTLSRHGALLDVLARKGNKEGRF
jgi:Domain of unknown function (DUF4350)